MPGLSVAIVGGGIGGTAAALCLLRSGIDVHVYEQARELREVGAGVQISPNASRVLHRLGLADALADMGVKPLAWHQRRWQDGRTLLRTPLAETMEAAFGSPHYQMHRADVLRTLVCALPTERVHVGHHLTGVVDHGDRVEAEFENEVTINADVLVGADGIHSTVRRILFGPEQPHFTGCMCYRGLVPVERLAHLQIPVEAQIWMGPGKHFVHYYVRNKQLLNFVAVIDQDTWTKESWTDRGDITDAIAAYEGWHPQLHGILEAVEETFIWALFDRPPGAINKTVAAGSERGALGPELCGVLTTIGLRMVPCGGAGGTAGGCCAWPCCACARLQTRGHTCAPTAATTIAAADAPPASLLDIRLDICPLPLRQLARLAVASWLTDAGGASWRARMTGRECHRPPLHHKGLAKAMIVDLLSQE